MEATQTIVSNASISGSEFRHQLNTRSSSLSLLNKSLEEAKSSSSTKTAINDISKQFNKVLGEIDSTETQKTVASQFLQSLSYIDHDKDIIIEASVENEIVIGYISEKGEMFFAVDEDGDSIVNYSSVVNANNNFFMDFELEEYNPEGCVYFFLK